MNPDKKLRSIHAEEINRIIVDKFQIYFVRLRECLTYKMKLVGMMQISRLEQCMILLEFM